MIPSGVCNTGNTACGILCVDWTNSRVMSFDNLSLLPGFKGLIGLFTLNLRSPLMVLSINAIVYGVPMIGALYLCASFATAPIWSKCPCENTIAFTWPSTSFINVSSGMTPLSIKSRLCILSISVSSCMLILSKWIPMSNMITSSPILTAVMFFPTSSYPPTAITSTVINCLLFYIYPNLKKSIFQINYNHE